MKLAVFSIVFRKMVKY